MLLASADENSDLDVSPKGYPPGFIKVLDKQTLAIPDRPGNNRVDSIGKHPAKSRGA
jgi:predicted pyridoxine 5'-phosphate oxidase superfamily flavin-nucleotide-binding protein